MLKSEFSYIEHVKPSVSAMDRGLPTLTLGLVSVYWSLKCIHFNVNFYALIA